jgi:hypothetical protein
MWPASPAFRIKALQLRHLSRFQSVSKFFPAGRRRVPAGSSPLAVVSLAVSANHTPFYVLAPSPLAPQLASAQTADRADDKKEAVTHLNDRRSKGDKMEKFLSNTAFESSALL